MTTLTDELHDWLDKSRRQLGTLSLALRSLVDSPSSSAEGGDDNDRGGPMNTVRYGVSTLSLTH